MNFFTKSNKVTKSGEIQFIAMLVMAFFFSSPVIAQTIGYSPRLITQNIDDRNLVRLAGNTRPEANPANDLGLVSDDLMLHHMYLLLKPSPQRSQAATTLISQLHEANSPHYHQWLSADEIANQFGPSTEDVNIVTSWLNSHGFTVNHVYLANGVIDFSGPASAIHQTFHTEIHHFSFHGAQHIANTTDPSIPAALASAVHGIVSLHNFHPKPALRGRADYTLRSNAQPLVPGDLATIYNMNPLYAKGISGQGQTIVVIEDSNLYNMADWHAFRNTFGLTQKFPQGSLSQIHPQPTGNPSNGGPCANPGVNEDDAEAAIDVEWATAAAPSAAIVLASCADTNANFGGFIALQNLLTGRNRPPAIVSISYGESESYLGSTGNAYINRLYQLAVLQGVSIFVASGDAGADTSDQGAVMAKRGINISGFATTPNNVAVGGTDFADNYLTRFNSPYWSAKNGAYYNSALSYIPEIPWNDSCASQLLASYYGFAQTYGRGGFCNSTSGQTYNQTVTAGSGGPSSCASGNPATAGVVGGTCRGYPKPSFQAQVYGNPKDGVRDIPDVSLFAGDGVWGHYYVACYSDPAGGGTSCAGKPADWSGFGGTSVATPIMAGIQAMINQTSEMYQGNPNFTYYKLAASAYGAKGNSACSATKGTQVNPNYNPACIFNNVTLGDNDVNCRGSKNCFLDGATNGVLSVTANSYQPAYLATPGYNYPTGIGSVNAYQLVTHWPGTSLK